MSRNQKAPLLAFVLVALVCGLILVDSMRGEALVRRLPISVLAPTQPYENVVPSDRGPSATEAPAEVPAEASTATSPGVLPDPFASTSSDGVSGFVTSPDAGDSASGQDQASTAGDLLGSVTMAANDAADAVSGSDPAQDPVIPDPGNGSPGSGDDAATGPPSAGPPPGLGHPSAGPKDPSAGLADLGPDGGRPDIHPDEVEPTDEPVVPEAPADAVDESEETLPGAEQPQLRKPHNEARKRDRAKAKGKK